jgi:hypothetical protein
MRLSPARTGEHLNVRTLDRWEAGEYTIPQRYWGELATLFGVSVDYLLGWSATPGNGPQPTPYEENSPHV